MRKVSRWDRDFSGVSWENLDRVFDDRVARIFFKVATVVFGKTSWQGAQSIIHASVKPSKEMKGHYLSDCRIGESYHPQFNNDGVIEMLWAETVALLRLDQDDK